MKPSKPKLTRAAWSCAPIAALLALAPAAGGQDCNLVLNGSFELPPVAPGEFQFFEEIPGWERFFGGRIEIWNSYKGWDSHSGEQHIELDNDMIRAALPTSVGMEYRVSFAYAPRPLTFDNHVRAYWGGEKIADIQMGDPGPPAVERKPRGIRYLPNSLDWQVFTTVVEATDAHTLLILEGCGADPMVGMLVDSVSVEHVATAIPRNGSGVNPGVLTSVTPPALGTTWTLELDCQHNWGVAYFFAKTQPDPGTLTMHGEILIDGLQLMPPLIEPHYRDTTMFEFELPNELAFCGRASSTQAICLGQPIEMSNALDVIWGQ